VVSFFMSFFLGSLLQDDKTIKNNKNVIFNFIIVVNIRYKQKFVENFL